jgi:hypothetical protein
MVCHPGYQTVPRQAGWFMALPEPGRLVRGRVFDINTSFYFLYANQSLNRAGASLASARQPHQAVCEGRCFPRRLSNFERCPSRGGAVQHQVSISLNPRHACVTMFNSKNCHGVNNSAQTDGFVIYVNISGCVSRRTNTMPDVSPCGWYQTRNLSPRSRISVS